MGDVAGELADEEEVTFGLLVCMDDQFTAPDAVLELPDRGHNGEELAVEGQIPGLGVGESAAEEGEVEVSLDGVDGGRLRSPCPRHQW